MSRKIKINYKNLNSNLKKITYHFFTDWIIEMLPVELMKFVLNHYKFLQILNAIQKIYHLGCSNETL